MWCDNGQIVISVDESNGHWGGKIKQFEKDLDWKLREKLEEQYYDEVENE